MNNQDIQTRLDKCFGDLKSLTFSKHDGMSCYGYVVNVKRHHDCFNPRVLDQWVEDKLITQDQADCFNDEIENGDYYNHWLNSKQEEALFKVSFIKDKEISAVVTEFIDLNSFGFYGRSGGWFGFWLHGGGDIQAWAENIKTMLYNDADPETMGWELAYVERALKAAVWITKTIDDFNKGLNFEKDLLADLKGEDDNEKPGL